MALIGAGVTLHGCLAAADELAESGIRARVIDLYSIKPIDRATLTQVCHTTGSRALAFCAQYRGGRAGTQ